MPYFQYYFTSTRSRMGPFLVGVLLSSRATGARALLPMTGASACEDIYPLASMLAFCCHIEPVNLRVGRRRTYKVRGVVYRLCY